MSQLIFSLVAEFYWVQQLHRPSKKFTVRQTHTASSHLPVPTGDHLVNNGLFPKKPWKLLVVNQDQISFLGCVVFFACRMMRRS